MASCWRLSCGTQDVLGNMKVWLYVWIVLRLVARLIAQPICVRWSNTWPGNNPKNRLERCLPNMVQLGQIQLIKTDAPRILAILILLLQTSLTCLHGCIDSLRLTSLMNSDITCAICWTTLRRLLECLTPCLECMAYFCGLKGLYPST